MVWRLTGLVKYLKAALTNRWNLLALFGGIGFALVTGRPDVFLPLVLAGETTYLTLLASHGKFQRYVDVQDAKTKRAQYSQSTRLAAQRMLKSLPKPTYERFQQLRQRCLELRQIASDMKQPGLAGAQTSLDSLQLAGLDRLLWVYLRLLFTRHALARFLERTKVETIQQDIAQLQRRLAALEEGNDLPHTEKIRYTLEDNLKTCHDRLANYEKAQANHEFVQLETHRLENKIKSLAEVAVNRQEPDFISSQVDQVAESVLETERTMNELEFVTGLGQLDEAVPPLLETRLRTTG